MYQRAGAYSKALDTYQKALQWQQVFCMAVKLGMGSDQQVLLARSMAGIASAKIILRWKNIWEKFKQIQN